LSWCRRLFAAGAVVVAAGAAPAQATELTWGGSLAARAELVSNPSLTVPASAGAWRLTQSANGDFRANAGAWEAAANASLGINRSNQQTLDTTDGSLGGVFTRRFERGSAGFAASWRRDSTLASELQTTGVVLARAQRDSINLSANGLYLLSDRWSVNLGATLGAARYDRSRGAAGLVDSDTQSATAGINYALGPRSSLGLAASLTRYDTLPFTTASRSASLQATWQYEVTDRLGVSAAYGPSRTHTDIAALARICPLPQPFCDLGLVPFTVFPVRTTQVADGYLYNLAVTHRAGPETRLGLAAARSVNPSATGFVVQTDSLSGSLTHRLSDRLSLSAEAGTTRADSIVTALQVSTQRLSGSLSWQLAEAWTLEAGMRWQRAQYADGRAPDTAAVFAGLRYNLPRQRVTQW
jgi:hypothetical protein